MKSILKGSTLSWAKSTALQRTARATASLSQRSLSDAPKAPVKKSTWSDFVDSVQVVNDIEQISRSELRTTVCMPESLLERVTSVVQNRTHTQLEKLRNQQRELDKQNAARAPTKMHEHQAIGWVLQDAEEAPSQIYGPSETIKYLAYDMEASYACLHHVFDQIRRKNDSFQPKSVLDFGAGPGTASWVAKQFYEDSISSYRVVEPSQSMQDAAGVVLEEFPGLSVRRSLSEMSKEIGPKGAKYDLVVVNRVLSELRSDVERVAVMSALWELVSDDGMVVIVDRGSPLGSHHVRSARQFILDVVEEEEEQDARIVAPCPHHKACPAVGGTWCHFVQRAPTVQRPREASAKRWTGQRGSKFSYVAMEKKAQKEEKDIPHLGRLIRNPLLAPRHVHMDMCTPEGQVERRTVTRGKSIREVYRAARKAHWGAEWPADASVYRKE